MPARIEQKPVLAIALNRAAGDVALRRARHSGVAMVVLAERGASTTGAAEVIEVGMRAISALGLKDGFTHMEWFKRPDGSIAIGEIAQRPPGANITQMIGLAHGIDPYLAWARAVVDGAFERLVGARRSGVTGRR